MRNAISSCLLTIFATSATAQEGLLPYSVDEECQLEVVKNTVGDQQGILSDIRIDDNGVSAEAFINGQTVYLDIFTYYKMIQEHFIYAETENSSQGSSRMNYDSGIGVLKTHINDDSSGINTGELSGKLDAELRKCATFPLLSWQASYPPFKLG